MQRSLGDLYDKRPLLNFGPAFSTIAMKMGSSEVIHFDCNDDPRFLTWLIPVGHWLGGRIVLPQLNQSIELRPRCAFGFTARLLAHCSCPVTTGTRVIFTCFMEKNLLKHADEEFFQGMDVTMINT